MDDKTNNAPSRILPRRKYVKSGKYAKSLGQAKRTPAPTPTKQFPRRSPQARVIPKLTEFRLTREPDELEPTPSRATLQAELDAARDRIRRLGHELVRVHDLEMANNIMFASWSPTPITKN